MPTTASFVPLFLEPSILIDLVFRQHQILQSIVYSFIIAVPWRRAKRWTMASNDQPKKEKIWMCVQKNCHLFGFDEAYSILVSSCCLMFIINFCIQCKAYRSLSMYVDYPVGCYVYSSLTVQSLPKSTILILVFMGPCIPGGRACW